jgi:hypothetical protein
VPLRFIILAPFLVANIVSTTVKPLRVDYTKLNDNPSLNMFPGVAHILIRLGWCPFILWYIGPFLHRHVKRVCRSSLRCGRVFTVSTFKSLSTSLSCRIGNSRLSHRSQRRWIHRLNFSFSTSLPTRIGKSRHLIDHSAVGFTLTLPTSLLEKD